MPASRPRSFRDALAESLLLTAEQVAEIARAPLASLDTATLAKELVRRGWLTSFQVDQLREGDAANLVLGPYRLLGRLGEGNMGQVFKAHHVPMNRPVALKLIRKEKLANPTSVARFYREVQVAAKLLHPNIVLALDAGQIGETHYLAMEYVDGQDLSCLVKAHGPLPIRQACDFIRQVALGLQHAHERGLIHRDIKPSNLLVTTTANSDAVVKILDMGLARPQVTEQTNTALTQFGAIVGSPDYLAPEQAANSGQADIRSDLYGLGCTLFFLLTGQPPFRGKSVTDILLKHQMEAPPRVEQLRPDVPPSVAAIVQKLLAKTPEDRYQTPAELIAALQPLCQGDAEIRVAAPSVAPIEQSSSWTGLTDAAATEASASEGDFPKVALPRIAAGMSRKRKRLLWFGVGTIFHLIGVVLLIVVLTRKSGESTPEANQDKPARTRGIAEADPRRVVPFERERSSVRSGPPATRPTGRGSNPQPRPRQPETATPAVPETPAETPDTKAKPSKPRERQPIPSERDQADAAKGLREIYKTEYARRAPIEQRALAETLYKLGRATTDDPAKQYVCLREARTLWAQSGDIEEAFKAIDKLAEDYVVDVLTDKTAALNAAGRMATNASALNKPILDTAQALALQAVADDNYEAALRLMELANAAALRTRNQPILFRVSQRAQLVRDVQKEYERVAPALATLKQNPKDADANLAAGKFLCWQKGDWDKGLPLLAQSSDAKLQSLAQQDVAKPVDSSLRLAVADGWWAVAETERGLPKNQIQRHAHGWYKQTVTDLSGAAKTQVERRIKEIETGNPLVKEPFVAAKSAAVIK
jgi:serine/threonine protein kinase